MKGSVNFFNDYEHVNGNLQLCLGRCDSYGCSAIVYQGDGCETYVGALTGSGDVNVAYTTYIYVAQPATTATLSGYQYSNPTGMCIKQNCL